MKDSHEGCLPFSLYACVGGLMKFSNEKPWKEKGGRQAANYYLVVILCEEDALWHSLC